MKIYSLKFKVLAIAIGLTFRANSQNFQQNYFGEFNMINQSILIEGQYTYIVGSVESNNGNYINLMKLDNSGSMINQVKINDPAWTLKAYSVCKYEENFLLTGYAQKGSLDKDVLLIEFDSGLNIVSQSVSPNGQGTDDVGTKVYYDPLDENILVLSYKLDLNEHDAYRTAHVSYFKDPNTHIWTHSMAAQSTFDVSFANSPNEYNFIESIVSDGNTNDYYIAGSYTQEKHGIVVGSPSVHYGNTHGVFFAKARFGYSGASSGLIWDKSFYLDYGYNPDQGNTGASQEFAVDLLYYSHPGGNTTLDRIYLLINSSENHGYGLYEFDSNGNVTGTFLGDPSGSSSDNFHAMSMSFTENKDIVIHGYSNSQSLDDNYLVFLDRASLTANSLYRFNLDFDYSHVSTLGANEFDQLNSFNHVPLLARVSHNSVVSEYSDVMHFIGPKNTSSSHYTGIEHVKIDLQNYDESDFCAMEILSQTDVNNTENYVTVEWYKTDELSPENSDFQIDGFNVDLDYCNSETIPGTAGKANITLKEGESQIQSLFPNPTNGSKTINLVEADNSSNRTFIITNVLGQVVMEGNLNPFEEKIIISELPFGTYYLQVENNSVINRHQVILTQ